MANPDQIQRFLFKQSAIRGELVGLKQTYLDILGQHSYPAMVQRLLGEFCVASVLLSGTLKFEGSMTLQFRGSGPLNVLMAECSDKFDIRAIARWDQSAKEEGINDEDILENGILTITIDPRRGERYQGIVNFEGGALRDALETYFRQPEQIRTGIWLSSDNQGAAGMILQALPEDDSGRSMENSPQHWEHLLTLAQTTTEEELRNLSNEELLYRLFHQENVTLYDAKEIKFSCSCSWERSSNALLSLGREDTLVLLHERDGNIVIDCEFCGKRYNYDQQKVEKLFSNTTH